MRTLPLRVAPVEGESLPSYVERLADRLSLPLLPVLQTTGIVDRGRGASLPRGYGVVLSKQRRRHFARATALSDDRIAEMLLSRFDGIAFDFSGIDEESAEGIRAVALREWVYAAGSHVCPECIGETSAWQVAWKLPWSFACLRHECLLASHCTACGARTGDGRRDGSTAPALIGQSRARPGHCRTRQALGRRTGRSAEPCGFPLELLETESLARWPEFLDAQEELMRRLEGSAPFPGAALAFFRRLRGFVALVLAVGELETLRSVPNSVQSKWDEHLRRRDATAADRASVMRAGIDGRRAPKTALYRGTPEDAALMAAAVLPALRIESARASSDDELMDALAPFAEAARRLRPKHGYLLPRWFSFPPDVTEAYLTLWQKTSSHFFIQRTVGEESAIAIDPELVPQLYWRDRFAGVVELLDGPMSEPYIRQFCSMALLRVGREVTWAEAGGLLGLDPEWAIDLATRGAGTVKRKERERFWALLRADAEHFARSDVAINYREREQALREFTQIPRDDWFRICVDAKIHQGQGSKNRNAAAWLWAELTSGDWRRAPAFNGAASRTEVELFRRYSLQSLKILRPILLEWGHELLDGSVRSSESRLARVL